MTGHEIFYRGIYEKYGLRGVLVGVVIEILLLIGMVAGLNHWLGP